MPFLTAADQPCPATVIGFGDRVRGWIQRDRDEFRAESQSLGWGAWFATGSGSRPCQSFGAYLPAVMRTLAAALVLVLAAACSENGSTRVSDAEGRSINACKSEVERRNGETFDKSQPPWRITSRDEADGYVVNVWTQTPRDAQRPTGVPDYVCVTKRDSGAENGIRLVQVRP